MTQEPQPTADYQAIRRLVAHINDAWLHHPGTVLGGDLEVCFAKDLSPRRPRLPFMATGRDFGMKTYKDFAAQATILRCTVGQPDIDLSGDTAAANYTWQITYAVQGQEYTDRGHDLLVFARHQDQWIPVWRAILPEPAPPPGPTPADPSAAP